MNPLMRWAEQVLTLTIKERRMYGNPGLGAGNTVAGVSLLPATGNSTLLFTVAVSLIVTGVAIMVASIVVARKNRTSEAN
jgi:predicted phage tail protein